jgi:endonuclease YncB( thermonuclease family)
MSERKQATTTMILTMVAFALFVAVLFMAFFRVLSARAEPIAPGAIHVIDGDTIAVGPERYRLVGFDAPEAASRARCPAERALAAQATQRLRRLVAAGGLDLTEVDCRCRPGTAGTPRCNHGRRCGRLTAAGRDVGELLIAEGLAQPYVYDPAHPAPPADWCGR